MTSAGGARESSPELEPGAVLPLCDVPELDVADLRRMILRAVSGGGRVLAFFGCAETDDRTRLYAVVTTGGAGTFFVACSVVQGSFSSLTPECAQVHRFEREIAEQWGVVVDGHPRPAPIRYQRSHRSTGRGEEAIQPAVMDFYRVEGDEIHEVAVGPVHAGVIEPGHFRFQCHGEVVLHLEIALGFQHRGIERALVGGPTKRTLPQMETIAGDTSIGHGLAYCRVIESLSGTVPSPRAVALRAIALELERLANHTGDLGALAADIGYLPTASFCGRVRGEFLNCTALLCGSRFGRSFLLPGGTIFDTDETLVDALRAKLAVAGRDALDAGGLLWDTPSVLARFQGTGVVSREHAETLGLVGVSARACGLERDVRAEFPFGAYRKRDVPIVVETTGDVYARARVRFREIRTSLAFIMAELDSLPAGSLRAEPAPLRPESLTVSLVEGWRGEVCHIAITDERGSFIRYKVVDPSFHNWSGLEMALRNEEISDFPVCNKSFNLSYCGHDL